MHRPHPRFPTQGQLCFPILDVLASAGAPMRAAEVAEVVADRFALSATERTETVAIPADGQRTQLWGRHLRFAKQKLVERGLVQSARHGYWTLTDEGLAGTQAAAPGVAVRVWVSADGAPLAAHVETVVALPTVHTCVAGDSRDLGWIDDCSIHLGVTSPPYLDLKSYGTVDGQLGDMADYEAFLAALDQVWAECARVLVPGGKLAVNVGDVLRSRRRHGEHELLPLHADIAVRGRRLGFKLVNGIIWQKRGNMQREQAGRGSMLGKPFQPNGRIPLANEHIVVLEKRATKAQRYRQPTAAQRAASIFTPDRYTQCFRGVWDDIPGASTKGSHPAPFPVEIPARLIEMFSFAGDTVLDPFAGRFTTAVAALRLGRHSVGVDVVEGNVRAGIAWLREEALALAAA